MTTKYAWNCKNSYYEKQHEIFKDKRMHIVEPEFVSWFKEQSLEEIEEWRRCIVEHDLQKEGAQVYKDVISQGGTPQEAERQREWILRYEEFPRQAAYEYLIEDVRSAISKGNNYEVIMEEKICKDSIEEIRKYFLLDENEMKEEQIIALQRPHHFFDSIDRIQLLLKHGPAPAFILEDTMERSKNYANGIKSHVKSEELMAISMLYDILSERSEKLWQEAIDLKEIRPVDCANAKERRSLKWRKRVKFKDANRTKTLLYSVKDLYDTWTSLYNKINEIYCRGSRQPGSAFSKQQGDKMAKKYTSLKEREYYTQKTEVRIQPRTYNGYSFLDIREYYFNGKEMKPSPKGITIPADEKDVFLKAITKQLKNL